MRNSLPHLRWGRRMAAFFGAAVAVLVLSPAAALASSVAPYGEVTRFGGFDTSAYDNEAYGGSLTGGKFLNPVGFTVDTKDASVSDGTAVYVLDRVSDWGIYLKAAETEWRLQKLSDTGTVLGTTIFTLPNSGSSALGVNSPTGVLGLAIDDSAKRIYTLLYGTSGSGNSATPYAQEVLGWSTEPQSGKLVAPSGATLDSVSKPAATYTAPGVFSTSSQLQSTPLYDPQGLALDITGGQDYLAIEADGKARAANGAPQGPTIVEQVSPTSGAETASWISSSLKGVSNSTGAAEEDGIAAGISTSQNGALQVLIDTAIGSSTIDAVEVPANLASAPTILASADIDPGNSDATPLLVGNPSGNRASAGPQALLLGNGLYAADFYENTGGASYFNQAAAEGVRLVQPESGGVLSNPFAPATSIFDTLGSDSSSQHCFIGDGVSGLGSNGISLAAGANGSVWVLTAGLDSSAAPSAAADGPYTTGREVIELAPGATNACPAPAGTFELGQEGQPLQSASKSLTVPVGSTVDFDASSVQYPAGAAGKQAGIYAYEWDANGAGSFTTLSDSLGIGSFQPQSNASYKYTVPGVYTATLTVLGDFGTYEQSDTVTVQASSPPTAAFTTPSEVQTGQTVTLDASGSQPASGASIAAYEWKFGDGGTDDTQSSSETHVYNTAGTYTISLVVRDDDDQQSTQVSHQITVVNPPSPPSNAGSTTTTSTTTTKTTTSQASKATSKPKPLTTAQKLAAALKLCKKDKAKKKRAACEKAAKKKYAPKKKKSTTKKKK